MRDTSLGGSTQNFNSPESLAMSIGLVMRFVTRNVSAAAFILGSDKKGKSYCTHICATTVLNNLQFEETFMNIDLRNKENP